MNHTILFENQKKRLDFPLINLICFAMFNAWQMGFIFFMGPSLSVDGRTPLPISMDNITLLIALGYVLGILYMILIPHLVVLATHLSTACAFLTVIGLFLPLSPDILKILIYVHVFCCCFMISFETFIIVNYFSEKSAITHLTLAYSVALFLIAFIQNDVLKISFSSFRILTLMMLLMMMYFFFRLPTNKESLPRYVKRKDLFTCPKGFFLSICVLMFISCLMMLCGPAAAGEIRNGVSLSYFMDALCGFVIYVLYKRKNIHPLRSISVAMGLSIIGFLLLFTSIYVPVMAYPACALIGCGFIPCQFIPLYGVVLVKTYPSRFIAPLIMTFALITVLIHSALLELFRGSLVSLYLAYITMMVILCALYMVLAPFIINTLQQKIIDEMSPAENLSISQPQTELLSKLTKREYEVLNLLSFGYSNADIAKMLVISEHTVNDYTKKIYRKLDVHSRHAAASLFRQYL